MIPLRDDVPSRGAPRVVPFLIFLNVVGYLIQWAAGPRYTHELALKPGFILAWWRDAMVEVPRQVPGPGDQIYEIVEQFSPHFFEAFGPLLTSQFLHGDLLHLGANLLFLWIFADNVEGELGPRRFLGFYLLCGVLAGLAHFVSDPTSLIPTIGASGAIAGVLGAYFVRFPHARVLTVIPIFIFPLLVEVPAVVFLGLWFVLQVLTGLFGDPGYLAVWAHAGGFVAGMVLVGVFPRVRQRGPRPRYVSFERVR